MVVQSEEELSKILKGIQDLDKIGVENRHSIQLIQKTLEMLELNLKESFGRVDKRITKLEGYHLSVGCVQAQTLKHDLANLEQKINKQQESVTWVVRTVIGAIMLAIITFVLKSQV